MHQLGLNYQRPLHRADEQNAARLERWKQEEIPLIGKLTRSSRHSC
jgi:transposase